MSSVKRKAPASTPYENSLIRRVRARREPSEELEDEISEAEAMSEGSESSSSSSSTTSEQDADEPDTRSFGEILKAEAKASKTTKRDKNEEKDMDPKKLAKVKEGLKTLGSLKSSSKRKKDDTWTNDEALERKAGRKDHRVFSRPNKHAPTEVSSKVPVSRFREILPDTRTRPRDPRFEPLSGLVDERQIKKNYSFLDDYREDEMKSLKQRIKESKDAATQEKLKQQLRAMESQKKTQMRKDREQEVLDRHKKEEKELVKQGKKPFYLKEKEQKNRVLIEEFKGLSGGKLDHAIERRRKKLASREKKNLPWERRNAGD